MNYECICARTCLLCCIEKMVALDSKLLVHFLYCDSYKTHKLHHRQIHALLKAFKPPLLFYSYRQVSLWPAPHLIQGSSQDGINSRIAERAMVMSCTKSIINEDFEEGGVDRQAHGMLPYDHSHEVIRALATMLK